MATRDLIAIGASAGGVEALQRLVAGLPADLPAAVIITQHLPNRHASVLPALLNRAGPLPAANPVDGEPILPGRIYIAPPDYHLILAPGRVHLSHGPRENLQRPCINAMFRSAAAAYGERVTGVLLTGLLDDGVAGLWEIQQRFGTTVVQDPKDATFPSMPENAIRGLAVQYIVPIGEMAPLLTRLAMDDRQPFSRSTPSEAIIDHCGQSCPDCGGAMVTARLGDLHEYRCHTGHRLGLETMISEKNREVDRALNVALSQSEELSALLETALIESTGNRALEIENDLALRVREQEILRRILGHPPKER